MNSGESQTCGRSPERSEARRQPRKRSERRGRLRDSPRGGDRTQTRGQATLVAFAVAVTLVVATVGVTLALADGAFASATREPADGRLAASTADRLTAADSLLTDRANVLNASRVDRLTADRLVARLPALANASFRVRLGDRTLVERGSLTDGATVRRITLLARETPRTRTVAAEEGIALPRRTDRVRLDFRNASVQTVRANDRVIAHDPGGLDGIVTAAVSRGQTIRLTFAGTGTVTLRTYPTQTRKLRLVVSVDVQ